VQIDSTGTVHTHDIVAGRRQGSLPGAVGGFAVYLPPTIGTPGDDQINGSDFSDDIDGNGGNDRIKGGGGDDTIRYSLGNGGDDVIDGGPGSDKLIITGTGGDAAYGIWTVAAYNAAHPSTPFTRTADILVTVGTSIVNELSNIEEIAINGGGRQPIA